MPLEDMNDIRAFLTVARVGSFTKAAAQLGLTQSSLSQTIRRLEARMGLRLLTRTTRSLSPTEAGDRLIRSVGPHFEEIEAELAALGALRTRPAGTVRIASSEHAANTIIWPKLSPLLTEYPEMRLEIFVDNGFTDIAGERFDAGVRLGESVDKDMVAVRIGPDLRMVVVGSPDYFARHPKPITPDDLTAHNCINIRMTTSGGLYAWELEKDGRSLRVRVDGQLTLNSRVPAMEAVLKGYGLAFAMEDVVRPHIDRGELVPVLADWCQPFAGFHLYYPSRRQMSPVMALVVERLRANVR